MRDDSCGKCRFYEGKTVGLCHRFPPTPMDLGEKIHSVFPLVDSLSDWCGEFMETVKLTTGAQ